MSLLKAARLNKRINFEGVKDEFKTIFEDVCDLEYHTTIDDLADLVEIYAQYSVMYLTYVATTLEEPKEAQTTMKFMNSIIAEVTRMVGVHYYHADGHSIVDKPIQDLLDDKLTILSIKEDIAAIEASYLEQEEVEEQ